MCKKQKSTSAVKTKSSHSHCKVLYCTAEDFKAQQTALKHSRKFYYIAGSFIAQQKVLQTQQKKSVLRQKLEKSSFCGKNWRKVSSAAETKDKPQVLPAVSVLLTDEAQFTHKPDQIELQLDRSQLPYLEYSGQIPQEAAQPTLTTKRPTTTHYNESQKNIVHLIYIYIYFRESFINLWCPLLMIALYHQAKTPINFWCRQGLNPRSLIQPSGTLPVGLTGTHILKKY